MLLFLVLVLAHIGMIYLAMHLVRFSKDSRRTRTRRAVVFTASIGLFAGIVFALAVAVYRGVLLETNTHAALAFKVYCVVPFLLIFSSTGIYALYDAFTNNGGWLADPLGTRSGQ